MNDDLKLLYGWIKGSRQRVFAWLDTLPPEVFTQERPDFAYGSLRNIQAHVAGCYRVWVGGGGLQLQNWQPRLTAADIPDVAAMRAAFAEVDDLLETAFGQFTELDKPLEIDWRGQPITVTQRWLLMHPMTHEFHHKGQLLALGRVLGHPYPDGPDTDLPLPFEEI